MRPELALALCLLLPAPRAAALELSSWEIRASSPALLTGDFLFSGALEVRGVELRKEGIFMPAEEFAGSEYRDVKLLSRKAYAAVEAAFKAGPGKGRGAGVPGKISWKVKAFRPVGGKARKANADIDIDGDLLVTAGLVLSRRPGEKYWVAWPGPLVFLDRDLRRRIETVLLDRAGKEIK